MKGIKLQLFVERLNHIDLDYRLTNMFSRRSEKASLGLRLKSVSLTWLDRFKDLKLREIWLLNRISIFSRPPDNVHGISKIQ